MNYLPVFQCIIVTNSTIILSFQMSHCPSVNETAPVTEMSRHFKVMKAHYILLSVKFSIVYLSN